MGFSGSSETGSIDTAGPALGLRALPARAHASGRLEALLTGAGVWLALALLLALAAMSYRAMTEFERESHLVGRTQEVKAGIETLRRIASRARFFWRNYIMKGDAAVLDDYRQGVEAVGRQIDALEEITADNPAQQARVAGIRGISAREFEELEDSVRRKRAGSLSLPDAIIDELSQGRPTVTEFVRLAAEMLAEEDALLKARREESENSSRVTRAFILVGGFVSLAVLLAAVLALRRQIRQRAEAERSATAYATEVEDLYNKAPCAYHSVDANGIFLRINDTWLSWLGYAREEVVGKMRHSDLMTEASARYFREDAFPRFRRDGRLEGVEFDYVRKDGSVLIGLLHATTVYDEAGSYQMSRSTVFDITERMRTRDERLRLNAELQATNKELEAFSYSVSHDLRAPLRAVDGYARMLEEDYADRLDEEGLRLIGVVRGEASKMGMLIDDLLAFSRLGRKAMALDQVDMSALAREVADELLRLEGGRKIEIEIGSLPPVQGDRGLLRQVWANLIGNAVKYTGTREKAEIRISGRRVERDCEYRIGDNGVGFNMKYADKLFGVFQRLHAAEEFEGTGVGLAIVQRVVSRHGGTVGADARPGEGAEFRFTLPGGH